MYVQACQATTYRLPNAYCILHGFIYGEFINSINVSGYNTMAINFKYGRYLAATGSTIVCVLWEKKQIWP